ncbi:hypothetical protein HYT33_03710 [Candidatus Roizmanbacteria bacterium]|nr:hypothetical protein [Candidatus Roizmanbacteria bacterium]
MKKRRESLNSEKTLLVVTDYPSDRYSERVLEYLSKTHNILVLAQKDGKKRLYHERKRLTIAKVWSRGNNVSLLRMLAYVVRYDRVHNILFQFDLKTFGGVLPLILLPVILLVLKTLGKYTYVELHRLRYNHPLYILFYQIIGKLTDKIIVVERNTKQRLLAIVPEVKIAFLPLVILKKERISKRKKVKEALRNIMKSYKNTVSKAYHLPPSDLAIKVK